MKSIIEEMAGIKSLVDEFNGDEQDLKCGSCLAWFRAVHYWNYDHGRGVCRECCENILTRKPFGRPDPARHLIKRTIANQWPKEAT